MKKLQFTFFLLIALGLLLASRVMASEESVPKMENVLYSFKDDVEWHDDFAIDDIEGWIMLDLDGLIPSGPFQTYPNQNLPQSFIVYNPSKTNPPNTFPEYQPRSGDKVFMSISSNNGPSNNWMITRELAPHNGGKFSFYAKGTFDFFGDEEFKVGYSTTSSDPDDFSFFNAGNPYTATYVWTRYEFDIPAGTKHIAIVGVSYAYCLMIDDIEFSANVDSLSPGMINDFESEMDLGEQLAVHISWTNPVQDATGGALTEISGVRIFRGSHPMSFIEIAILDEMEPGEEVYFTDNTLEGAGFFAYRIVPFNSNGDGLRYTSGFLFLDYETIPGAPHTIDISRNENNETVISWNEVNYGENGGILQDPVVGYTLTRKAGDQIETLVEMHPGTSFVETEIPDFNLYTYAVIAHVSFEETGEPGSVNGYSGMTPNQQPVTNGKYESEQVFELTRSSIISQSIYYAEEMGETGLITGLAYFSNLGSSGSSNIYKIYMSTTSRQVFGTTLNNAIWEYFGNQKLVYEGPITFDAGPRAIEIDLDQPFFYDAGNNKNVIITVVKPLTTNIPSVTNRVFYNTQVEGMRTYYAIGYSVDMSTITTQPASWATEEIGTIPSIVTTRIQDFASIAGMVTTADGISGLEDVTVTVHPSDSDPNTYQEESTHTQADGSYEFEALLPGNYVITFFKEGFNTQVVEADLSPEQELELNISLFDAEPITISGTVTNSGGDPLANVYVILTGYSLFNAITDDEGAFALDAYSEKDYQLEISHPLYNPYEDSFTSGASDYSLGIISLDVALHKPMNVVAVLDENGTQLDWEIPYGLDHESLLAWGSLTNVNDGWGAGGDPFIAGIRFSYLDLQESIPENGKLTHVKVCFHNYANFIIKVFQGSNASTLLHQQPGSVSEKGWYVFELDQAILIDQTQEFWIGIHFLPGYGAYPIGIDEGPNAPLRKGSMLYMDGTWTGMSLTNKNWNIYGIVHTTVEAAPLGYKVFRGPEDTPENDWNELTTSLVEQNSFTDAFILEEEPGIYYYGVMAQYGPELLSEMTLSNSVAHDMLFDVGFVLQPDAPIPATVFLRLWNNEHYYEARVEDLTGPVQISDIWRGEYQLEIQADNFETMTMSHLNIEENRVLEIALEERKVMPSGLIHEMSEDGSAATLFWSLHDSFLDNLESYPDFEKTSIGDYILIDGDGLPTYTYTNFTWPGAGNPMSFMILNPFATSPPINLDAVSGRRFLVAMAGPDGANNDWLIIPAGPGTFSFMGSSLVSSDLETIQILYSVTGSQTSDFTPFQDAINIRPPVQWTSYSFEAPEDTKYVAIRYVSNDTYFFMLDDLSYQKPFNHALSYNIYLDGALIAQEVTDQSFEITDIAAGTHLAEVEAVYYGGNSQKAQVYILGTVEVEELAEEPDVRIFPNPNNGNFIISLDEPASVSILDMSGQALYSHDFAEGKTMVYSRLKAGTYIIQIQTSAKIVTEKLVIK